MQSFQWSLLPIFLLLAPFPSSGLTLFSHESSEDSGEFTLHSGSSEEFDDLSAAVSSAQHRYSKYQFTSALFDFAREEAHEEVMNRIHFCEKKRQRMNKAIEHQEGSPRTLIRHFIFPTVVGKYDSTISRAIDVSLRKAFRGTGIPNFNLNYRMATATNHPYYRYREDRLNVHERGFVRHQHLHFASKTEDGKTYVFFSMEQSNAQLNMSSSGFYRAYNFRNATTTHCNDPNPRAVFTLINRSCQSDVDKTTVFQATQAGCSGAHAAMPPTNELLKFFDQPRLDALKKYVDRADRRT